MFFVLFFLFFSSLSIDDIINLALKKSFYLQSLREEIEVKELEILPSSSLPNPMIEVFYQNVGFDKFSFGKEEMTMLEFKVEQNLLYPKKRIIEEEISREKKELSLYFYKVAEAEIKKRVREVYAEIYSLRGEKIGLEEGVIFLDSLKNSISGSISSGKGSIESYLKAEMVLNKLKARIEEVNQGIFLKIEELKRLTASDFKMEDLKIESLPEIKLEKNFKENIYKNSPLIKYYEGILSLKEKEIAKRKIDLKPNIIAFSGIGIRGGMDPVISLGTSIELPFWKEKKEKVLILAKEKEISSFLKMLEEIKLKIKEDVNGAIEEISRINERLKIYKEGYLKTSSSSIDAALSLFISGGGDFSTVIENMNLWIEGMFEVSKLEAEKFKANSKILFHLEN